MGCSDKCHFRRLCPQNPLTEFNVDYDKGVEFSLATLVKKLCGYPKKNATMQALAEYNRVFKCLHMLDYADGKELRQVIQESLNRGEQLQGLKRALASLGGNRFRGKDPEEMEVWNACADLLANCIVYYNAKIMSSFKTHCMKLRQRETARVPEKHLASFLGTHYAEWFL